MILKLEQIIMLAENIKKKTKRYRMYSIKIKSEKNFLTGFKENKINHLTRNYINHNLLSAESFLSS